MGIVYEGRELGIKQFKKLKYIGKNFEPVIEVRAFPTKFRIQNVVSSESKSLLIDDAKKLIEQETGVKLVKNGQYLRWFAMTLGRNIALMHNTGLCHNYLTEHNITLDFRIVDTDSVGKIDNPEQSRSDFERASNSLEWLEFNLNETDPYYDHVDHETIYPSLNHIFISSYTNTLKKNK